VRAGLLSGRFTYSRYRRWRKVLLEWVNRREHRVLTKGAVNELSQAAMILSRIDYSSSNLDAGWWPPQAIRRSSASLNCSTRATRHAVVKFGALVCSHVGVDQLGNFAGVCTENLIRVDAVMESPKLAE
jgi:hypothetical protein